MIRGWGASQPRGTILRTNRNVRSFGCFGRWALLQDPVGARELRRLMAMAKTTTKHQYEVEGHIAPHGDEEGVECDDSLSRHCDASRRRGVTDPSAQTFRRALNQAGCVKQFGRWCAGCARRAGLSVLALRPTEERAPQRMARAERIPAHDTHARARARANTRHPG